MWVISCPAVILSPVVFLPYYSSPEEAEKDVEKQGAPDYKVVDPCPVPGVQRELEQQRKVMLNIQHPAKVFIKTINHLQTLL